MKAWQLLKSEVKPSWSPPGGWLPHRSSILADGHTFYVVLITLMYVGFIFVEWSGVVHLPFIWVCINVCLSSCCAQVDKVNSDRVIPSAPDKLHWTTKVWMRSLRWSCVFISALERACTLACRCGFGSCMCVYVDQGSIIILGSGVGY